MQTIYMLSIADSFNGLFDGVTSFFQGIVDFFKLIADWWNKFKDGVSIVFTDLWDKVKQLGTYISDIPNYVSSLYKLISFMPAWLTIFITLSISISILLLFIGRGRSN